MRDSHAKLLGFQTSLKSLPCESRFFSNPLFRKIFTLFLFLFLQTFPTESWALNNPTAATLPSGFSISLISANLQSPTHIEFAPDGRMFVSLKAGQLMVIKNGALLSTPFLTVDTDSAGEKGLIGVAFDPAFTTNAYVYVFYVAKTPTIHARISRFTANGDVAVPGSEKIIAELDDRGTSLFHVAGDMLFGPDGKLYVSSGDNAGYPFVDNSQSPKNTLGKILRFNPDGSIPADNPFLNSTSGISRSIWAYGLRNPFSFSISPSTQEMYINDVGQGSWEEINESIIGNNSGDNFGWPTVEGVGSDPKFKNPVLAYAHGDQSDDTVGCAVTGGAFYEPIIPQFPHHFEGKYFFMDYCNNWIHILDPATGAVSPFGTNVTSSGLGLTLGPDGSLYFMSQWFNSVYKLSYSGSPLPVFITQPNDQLVSVGSPVTFSVSASGQEPISFQWRKNGNPIPQATAANYTLSTTLTDDGAKFDCLISNAHGTATSRSATLRVLNSPPPAVTLDYPEPGTRYNAGDRVYFGATATDAHDGLLSPQAYTWNVYFHHDTHFHPFLSNKTDATAGYFQVPTQGESSHNTWFRIVLAVKNSLGLTTTLTREIYPNKSIFLLKSNPPGLQITLDGQPLTAPSFITGVVGFNRTLGVISPQSFGGITYRFDSWSDGLPVTHDIRTSISRRTYTANFVPVGSTRSGTLRATPNPALVCDGSGAGITTLSWNTTGTTTTEIRINAPNGNLLSASTQASGSVTTPKWVGDGSTFYLQDTSGGLPLTATNSLATVTVNLTSYGCNSYKNKKK